MKRLILTIFLSMIYIAASSQYKYSVETCWDLAKKNYPAIIYSNLINKSKEYTITNAAKLKQIGVDNSQTNKTGNTTGTLSTGNTSLQANYFVLNERVNNLYFSLILLEKKIRLNQVLQLQLDEVYSTFEASTDGKINNKNSLNSVSMLLKITKSNHQIMINLQNQYYDMLSKMIGRNVNSKSVLLETDVESYIAAASTRKEIQIIETRKSTYNPFTQGETKDHPIITSNVTQSKNVFEVSKGNNTITQTSLSDKNSGKGIKETLFKFNSNRQKEQERTEINNICQLIEKDKEKIANYKEIINVTYSKLMRGTTEISNLIQNIINFDDMHHTLAEHHVQLMMAVHKFQFLKD